MTNNKGFTLVEIIVVLVILAVLAAIIIPSLIGYIEKAQKNEVLIECRSAVTAAQTLYVESYGTGNSVTNDDIKAMAEVTGTISDVEVSQGVVLHLAYTNYPWTVTYCRNWETCSLHDQMFNFANADDTPNNDDSDPSGDEDDPGNVEGTVDYFYIANNEAYKVYTIGDLETYDFGQYGSTVTQGSVFYWLGDYYYTRNNQYLTNSSDREAYINNYGMKINTSDFTTPSASTSSGDLKLVNGNVYVFFPYARYENDYTDNNYWFEVAID